eukprot:gene14419-biopygen13034
MRPPWAWATAREPRAAGSEPLEAVADVSDSGHVGTRVGERFDPRRGHARFRRFRSPPGLWDLARNALGAEWRVTLPPIWLWRGFVTTSRVGGGAAAARRGGALPTGRVMESIPGCPAGYGVECHRT